jgi:hypothetical protein
MSQRKRSTVDVVLFMLIWIIVIIALYIILGDK